MQAIRHRSDARLAMGSTVPVRRGHPVRIGFTVGATNPKTIVFFVAPLAPGSRSGRSGSMP